MYIFALFVFLSIGQVWGHGGAAGYGGAHAAHAAHMMKHWKEEAAKERKSTQSERPDYIFELAVWRYGYRYLLEYIYNCSFYQHFFELSAEERAKLTESLVAIQCVDGSTKVCVPSDKVKGDQDFVVLSNLLYLYKRLELIVGKGEEILNYFQKYDSEMFDQLVKSYKEPGRKGPTLKWQIAAIPPHDDYIGNARQLDRVFSFLIINPDTYTYAENESPIWEERDKERLYVLSELLAALRLLKKKFAPSLLNKMAKVLGTQGDNSSVMSSSASSSSGSSTVIPGYTPKFSLEQLFKEIRMAKEFGTLKEEIIAILEDRFLYSVLISLIDYEMDKNEKERQKTINFSSRIYLKKRDESDFLYDPECEAEILKPKLTELYDKLAQYKKYASLPHNDGTLACLTDIDFEMTRRYVENDKLRFFSRRNAGPYVDPILSFITTLLNIKRTVSAYDRTYSTFWNFSKGKNFSMKVQEGRDTSLVSGSPASSSSSGSNRVSPPSSPESSPSGSPKN